MVMQSKSKIVPSFPDIKVAPGGRAGGILMGLQTAQAQGALNQKAALEQQKMGQTASMADTKNMITLYNKHSELINKRNEAILKTAVTPSQIEQIRPQLETVPSFNEFTASMSGNQTQPSGGAAFMGGGPTNGAPQPNQVPPQTPQTQAPQAAQGGQGMLQGMGNKLMSFGGDIKQALQGLLGAPQASAQAPGVAPGTVSASPLQAPAEGGQPGPNTEQIVQALEGYTNIDDIVDDLVMLDQQYNKAGMAFGDNVDNDAIIQFLRTKFGDKLVEEGIRKLQARIQ